MCFFVGEQRAQHRSEIFEAGFVYKTISQALDLMVKCNPSSANAKRLQQTYRCKNAHICSGDCSGDDCAKEDASVVTMNPGTQTARGDQPVSTTAF